MFYFFYRLLFSFSLFWAWGPSPRTLLQTLPGSLSRTKSSGPIRHCQAPMQVMSPTVFFLFTQNGHPRATAASTSFVHDSIMLHLHPRAPQDSPVSWPFSAWAHVSYLRLHEITLGQLVITSSQLVSLGSNSKSSHDSYSACCELTSPSPLWCQSSHLQELPSHFQLSTRFVYHQPTRRDASP